MISLRYADFLPGYTREEFESMVAQLRAFLAVGHNEDGTVRTVSSTLGLAPVGAVSPYAGTSAPTGWLLCDGSQVSRVTYKSLFEVVTTTYGVGDGSTTFNLPDLRQRFPLGKAAAGTGATLGSTGGAIDHVHTGPSHTHTGPSHTHTGPSHTHTVASSGGQTTDGEAAHTHTYSGTTAVTGATSIEKGTGATSVTHEAHTHDFSGTTSAGSSHSHTINAHDHGGVTGASGTGDTGASGTGATGASGTGNTGTENPPFVALNYIIYAGTEA